MAQVTRGRILRGDNANWDGKTATSTRVDATGGTITGLAIGNEVDVLQVYGAGTSRSRGTIANAVQTIGSSTTCTLVFAPGEWTIDESLTIPSNFTCHVPTGCVFAVSASKTLTFSGHVLVEYPTSWFSGSGTVTVSVESIHSGVYFRTTAEVSASVTPSNYRYPPGHVKRYGAAVDGSTDDTSAWQQATDQCFYGGSPVCHPYGTSMAALISYRPGVTYEMGAGAIVKCLPNQANFSGRVFTAIGARIFDDDEDSAPITWRGGIIDGNKANQGTYTGGEKEHNCGIFLGAGDSGGRLVVRIDGVRFQNHTGDGVQVHSNVDATIDNIECFKCWRSGVSMTGGFIKVRGSNWRLYGDSTDRSDFDIELDGVDEAFNGSGQMDIQLSNIDVADGHFDVSTSDTDTHDSRIVLTNINHRGIATTWGTRGCTTMVSNSHFRVGAMDDSLNRLIWPWDLRFSNCVFEFYESVAATATFALDVWFNTGGTTDTDQIISLTNCSWMTNSSVDSADTVYGVHLRASPAADNNVIEINGGHFDTTLDEVFHTLGGGKLRIKGSPFFGCPLGISLIYSSTNFWDVEVHGSIEFGSGLTTYLAIDQGLSNNIIKHYNFEVDEAFNVLSDVGGTPANNTFRGRRVIYVASAPTAATHGNVGDIARIKAPAAGGIVDYVCTTRGVGSGAVWKALSTAAA